MNRKMLFCILILAVLLVAGVSTSAGSPEADPPVLARVELAGRVDELNLPVYAHLQGADGRDYALVMAPLSQLEQSGLDYQDLDTYQAPLKRGPDRGAYVVAVERRPGERERAGRVVNVLYDDGRQIVARATPEEAEALAELGLGIQWLGDEPLVWRAPSAALVAGDFVPSTLVAGMVAQVQQDTVYTYTGQLSGEWPTLIGGELYTITTRHTASGESIQRAGQWVYEHMEASGLDVTYQDWAADEYSGTNVVGIITGTTRPDEIVVMIAHLDDRANDTGNDPAPGADDNGSGSVAVLIGAEIFSQYDFERTLHFVLTTGEEQGLYGARAHANSAAEAGQNIVAVYNMDMIAWDSDDDRVLRIHTRPPTNPGYPGDLAIANTFLNAVGAYGLSDELVPILTPDGASASDHSPFWGVGYSALLAIEDDYDDFNAFYHTSGDRLAVLNMPYYTNYAKASIGTVAHLASPVFTPDIGALRGVVSDASTTAPVADARVLATLKQTYTVQAMSDAAGVYEMHLSAGTYTLTASAYGYFDTTISDVAVTAGSTTTQDISLTPVPTYVVSGAVTDADAGWPLYASLEVAPVGWPGWTIWTDPTTGYYSLVLPEGLTHTLSVNAWAYGYDPTSRDILLTGDRVEDFPLAANMDVCLAPGHTLSAVLFESFEDDVFPPAGWAAYDFDGTGEEWLRDASNARYGEASALHDYAGRADPDQDGWLVTPEFTPVAGSELSFWEYVEWPDYYWKHSLWVCMDTCDDPPANYTETVEFDNPVEAWVTRTVNLSAYVGTPIRMAFRYEGWWADTWWIDHVVVSPASCDLQAGSLVVGNVYDSSTGAGVDGAKVSNDSGYWTKTGPAPDAAVNDGFYTLFSPIGSHVFTATKANHTSSSHTVDVVDGVVAWQDFSIWPPLDVTKYVDTGGSEPALGSVVTYTIVLANPGDVPALGVVITDPLPAGLSYGVQLQPGTAILPPNTAIPPYIQAGPWDIAVSDVVTISFTANITTNAAFAGQTIINTAYFAALDYASGESAPAAFTVAITPTADFSASPVLGTVPLTVTFSDESTNNPTSWTWDFGDGGSSTQQNPTHVYTRTGVFSVTLTASNAAGSDTVVKPNYITVERHKIFLPVVLKNS